jgi:hypothetical protein
MVRNTEWEILKSSNEGVSVKFCLFYTIVGEFRHSSHLFIFGATPFLYTWGMGLA